MKLMLITAYVNKTMYLPDWQMVKLRSLPQMFALETKKHILVF